MINEKIARALEIRFIMDCIVWVDLVNSQPKIRVAEEAVNRKKKNLAAGKSSPDVDPPFFIGVREGAQREEFDSPVEAQKAATLTDGMGRHVPHVMSEPFRLTVAEEVALD